MRRLILLCYLAVGVASCREPEPATNAAEDARISRGMEDVEAGQARSEADVAKKEADRRRDVKGRREEAE